MLTITLVLSPLGLEMWYKTPSKSAERANIIKSPVPSLLATRHILCQRRLNWKPHLTSRRLFLSVSRVRCLCHLAAITGRIEHVQQVHCIKRKISGMMTAASTAENQYHLQQQQSHFMIITVLKLTSATKLWSNCVVGSTKGRSAKLHTVHSELWDAI